MRLHWKRNKFYVQQFSNMNKEYRNILAEILYFKDQTLQLHILIIIYVILVSADSIEIQVVMKDL